jgi:hypothetical protein
LPNVFKGAVQVAVVANDQGVITDGDRQPVDAPEELLELGAVARQGLFPAVDDDKLCLVLAGDATAQKPTIVGLVVNPTFALRLNFADFRADIRP